MRKLSPHAVQLFPSVDELVLGEDRAAPEADPTDGTEVQLLPHVHMLLHMELVWPSKGFPAVRAEMGPLLRVRPLVLDGFWLEPGPGLQVFSLEAAAQFCLWSPPLLGAEENPGISPGGAGSEKALLFPWLG